MIITNVHKIPSVIAEAIRQSASEYKNGGSNLTASSLDKSPRIYWLEKRHYNELTIDVSDLVWSFLGTATHYMAEKAGKNKDKFLVEERFFEEINGWKFSAQVDNYDRKKKILTDFKITSVYQVMGEVKDSWIYQLNAQNYLMRKVGYDVEKLQICAILRDWQKRRATINSYPSHQVKVVNIPIRSEKETEEFLIDKVELLKSHANTADDDLPECTAKDKWSTPDIWAVYKGSSKRALKLHEDQIGAKAHASTIGGRIEFRKGEDIRCTDYCPVNKFCCYYKESQNEV